MINKIYISILSLACIMNLFLQNGNTLSWFIDTILQFFLYYEVNIPSQYMTPSCWTWPRHSLESVRLYNFCINSSFHQKPPFLLDPDGWFMTNTWLTLSYPKRFYKLSIWIWDKKSVIWLWRIYCEEKYGENYFLAAIMDWSEKNKTKQNN